MDIWKLWDRLHRRRAEHLCSMAIFQIGLAQWRGREHKAFWFVMRKCFHCRLQVYPLHSTVTLEEQNGVFLKPVHGFRKVKTFFFSHFSSVSLFLIINITSNKFYEPVLMTFLPQWQKFSSPYSHSSPYRWFFPPTLQRVQWLFQMSNMVGILICTLIIRIYKILLGTSFIIYRHHSDWLLPGPSLDVWQRNQLSVSLS